MASGGIAGLRADNMREFKEGGVLGFEDGGMPWYKKLMRNPESESQDRKAILDALRTAPAADSKLRKIIGPTEETVNAQAYADPSRAQDIPPAVATTPDVPPVAADPYADASRGRDVPPVVRPPTPPPVARPPVAGGGGAAQGIQSLMTEKLPSAAVDMAAVRQQRDPEYTKTLADYKAALAGKRDFSQEGLANLEQSKQEMMANRAKQDKDSAYLNLQ